MKHIIKYWNKKKLPTKNNFSIPKIKLKINLKQLCEEPHQCYRLVLYGYTHLRKYISKFTIQFHSQLESVVYISIHHSINIYTYDRHT